MNKNSLFILIITVFSFSSKIGLSQISTKEKPISFFSQKFLSEDTIITITLPEEFKKNGIELSFNMRDVVTGDETIPCKQLFIIPKQNYCLM